MARCGAIDHHFLPPSTYSTAPASAGTCHRHQEFIRFLIAVDAELPAGKAVHVILDNYAAHKHPKVGAWLDNTPG